jgi:ribosomal subunit interface protein
MELSPAQSEKLQAEFGKIGKLLDNGRGEAQAHVILAHEKLVNNVEITIPYHNHELVGHGSHVDLFSAVHAAIDKLEAQAIKVRAKWRDGRRSPRGDENETAALNEPGSASKPVEGSEENIVKTPV